MKKIQYKQIDLNKSIKQSDLDFSIADPTEFLQIIVSYREVKELRNGQNTFYIRLRAGYTIINEKPISIYLNGVRMNTEGRIEHNENSVRFYEIPITQGGIEFEDDDIIQLDIYANYVFLPN